MDFLYLQRGLESRPCREILYIRCTHIMRVLFCVFCMSIHWRSPPPPLRATDNSTFTLYFKYVFKDTLYFLLKYVLLPVLFALTQVVLLLITSTFTRVQIQSNLGTTATISGPMMHCKITKLNWLPQLDAFSFDQYKCLLIFTNKNCFSKAI